MDHEEIIELSKVQSKENCCVFCQSKCPQCGSVDIEVEYRRFYDVESDKLEFYESTAEIKCNTCAEKSLDECEEHDLPEGIVIGDGGCIKKVTTSDEYYYSPELASLIDVYFDNDNPLKLDKELQRKVRDEGINGVVLFYEYTNDHRNSIYIDLTIFDCDRDSENVMNDDTRNLLFALFDTHSITLECQDDPDNRQGHYVIESTNVRCLG